MDDSFSEPLDRERLQALYKEALEEHERFLNINQQLQKRLVQYFQEKKVRRRVCRGASCLFHLANGKYSRTSGDRQAKCH